MQYVQHDSSKQGAALLSDAVFPKLVITLASCLARRIPQHLQCLAKHVVPLQEIGRVTQRVGRVYGSVTWKIRAISMRASALRWPM